VQPTGVHPAPALEGETAIQINGGRNAIKNLSASLRILDISILEITNKCLLSTTHEIHLIVEEGWVNNNGWPS